MSILQRLRNLRLTWLIAFTAAALLGVWFFGGQDQLPLVLYKLSLVAVATAGGLLACRRLAPYATPGEFLRDGNDLRYFAALLFRAIVIAACIIGVCLGL